MLRIVIDTNVLISAAIRPDSLPDRLLRCWQAGEFEVVTCIRALDEVDAVLQRPHIAAKYGITAEKRQNLLILLYERVILVPGDTVTEVVLSDPDDDMFVACAVEGNAKYIVSGDNHLLALRRYKSVRILSAARFLNVLRRCQRQYGIR